MRYQRGCDCVWLKKRKNQFCMERHRRRKRNSGFSLIELVVVIAVLALLLAISLPMFLRFIEDAAIRAAQVALIDAHKECQIGIKRNISNPTYKIPQNNGYFQFPVNSSIVSLSRLQCQSSSKQP